jgi:hypothetical protein
LAHIYEKSCSLILHLSRTSQNSCILHVAGGLSKEEVIETNERLRAVRVRLEESYDTAKRSLITLMAKYTDSKSVRNVFHRYNLLRAMIKV